MPKKKKTTHKDKIQCKVCRSVLKDWINAMLVDGVGIKDIEFEMMKHGVWHLNKSHIQGHKRYSFEGCKIPENMRGIEYFVKTKTGKKKLKAEVEEYRGWMTEQQKKALKVRQDKFEVSLIETSVKEGVNSEEIKGQIQDATRKKTKKVSNDKLVKDTNKTAEASKIDDKELTTREKAKKSKIMQGLKKKQKDFDVISEMINMLIVQRDRVKLARENEQTAGVILGITGKTITDYQKSLKDVHELTKGMESLKELRYAELSQMIMSIFSRHEFSDRTRFEMFHLMASFETIVPITDTFEETNEDYKSLFEFHKYTQLQTQIKESEEEIAELTQDQEQLLVKKVNKKSK